ncbi:hypothetical protein HU200_017407 [Digitaria exilis]|uniref:starch synthase n=1 Tax=Digitaria exilis TaxID=1010633 RepID=A0A835F5Z5_9POAL|nr:hypothetical protein HU200_017407 [Digitaria exilis]
MSGAIASSSSAFLLLVASSSPRRRRSRVGAALRSCSYGGAEVRLHWARRGASLDGAPVVRAAAAPAGAEGEGATEAGESSTPTGVVVQGTEAMAAGSASTPRPVTSAPSSAANQNGALGSSTASKSAEPVSSESKAESPTPVTETETDASAKVEELKPAALDDAKESVGTAEPVEAKADAAAATDVAGSAADGSEDKEPGPLAGPNVMNIVVVASECAPFCKTGGLGDVVGALPKALARRGHRVMVVIPRYGEYAEARDLGVRRRYRVAGQDSEVTYFHSYIDGVDFVFIEAPPFRHRHDNIYGGERLDILKRMILFCKAAVEVPWYAPCGGAVYGDGNLVFIANDWHTALLPVYLKAYYRDNGLMQYARSVLVIHNIAHQGRGPVDDFVNFDLPEHYIDHFKLYDPVGGDHSNVFAAGLKMADRVVTVSSGYMWELKTSEGGWGLHDIINQNDWKLHGIVNGIDMKEWNPAVDVYLHSDGYTNYTFETLDTGKRQCKAALQQQLGLQVRDDVPLIGFIGRLDHQKGVDIIADAIHWIAGQDVQLVLLGTGRPDLEDMLRRFEAEHKDKVRAWVGFSVPMAHRITAGSDVLLMPSRFEPCGLNQLYAMAYGTVPVVHAVGGLRDTVAPFDPFADAGLGWTFDRAEANRMIDALGHCLNTYRNYKESWRGLQARGMAQDLSWDQAAELYEDVLVKAKYQW